MQRTIKYVIHCQHCGKQISNDTFSNIQGNSFFCPSCGKENVIQYQKTQPYQPVNQNIQLINNPNRSVVIKRIVFSLIAIIITGWLMTVEFDAVDSFAFTFVIVGFFIGIRRLIYFLEEKMNPSH